MWFVYRPDVHRVRGKDVRQVMECVQPGDILLRRFDGYINTVFTPGFWGHAGLSVGDNQVIHAVSTGTITDDILDFCRTDAVAVLEPLLTHYEKRRAVHQAKAFAREGIPYDYAFSSDNIALYCTELVDYAYSRVFNASYSWKMGRAILMPDGLRRSPLVRVRLEINGKEVTDVV